MCVGDQITTAEAEAGEEQALAWPPLSEFPALGVPDASLQSAWLWGSVSIVHAFLVFFFFFNLVFGLAHGRSRRKLRPRRRRARPVSLKRPFFVGGSRRGSPRGPSRPRRPSPPGRVPRGEGAVPRGHPSHPARRGACGYRARTGVTSDYPGPDRRTLCATTRGGVLR